MSQRLGKRRILHRPITVKEFLDVMQSFERNTNRKIQWATAPWWKKLYWKIRSKRRAAAKSAGRTQGGEAGKSQAARGTGKAEGTDP